MKAIEDLKMICGILDQLKLTRAERDRLDAAANGIMTELACAGVAARAAKEQDDGDGGT